MTLIVAFSISISAQTAAYLDNLSVACESGDTALVDDILKQWEAKEPDSPDMLWGKAQFLYATDRIDKDSLFSMMSKVVALDPKRLDLKLRLLDSQINELSTPEQITKTFCDVRNELFNDPSGWKINGDTLTEDQFVPLLASFAGDLVETINANSSIDIAKQFVDRLQKTGVEDRIVQEAKVVLAQYYSILKMYNEAIVVLKELLESNSDINKSALLFNIALYYSYLDNKKEALKYAKLAEKAGDDKNAPRLIRDLDTPEQQARYYDFVFQLLPRLLSEMPVSDKTWEMLMDPNYVVRIFKRNHYNINKDLSNVKAEAVPSDSGEIIVWTMPEPEEMTEPKYIAIVPDGDHYRMFTLEKTFDFEGKFKGDPYFAGGANFKAGDRMASHFSFGEYVDGKTCTPEQFVKLIGSYLKK